jgi:site-specific DNA-methyltransferase (adenine-specific)
MLGNCLELMKKIQDKSIDAIITDPPYGTTNCKWDAVIPFDLMWNELNRIVKDNGVIALFGNQPFSSLLITSNLKMYKHDWVWKKTMPKGHLNSKKYPMKIYEMIHIFSKTTPKYNPQMWKSKPMNTVYKSGGNGKDSTYNFMNTINQKNINRTSRFPQDVIEFTELTGNSKQRVHPTQKPVELMEYLVKTYTNENDTVLDFTMGSGTTGVACKNLKRSFIGIELDKDYFEIAKKRIEL